MIRNEKHMIPAYGCLVAINTMTASIDRLIPVMSRCLFQTGLLKLAMITPQIPFRIAMLMITIKTIFTHGLIPVKPNRDTVSEEPVPFPKAGMNRSMARRISKALHMSETYLLTNSFLSFSATVIISSEQISSSIVTEKKREISFNESMLGYPLPDSHLEMAVLETNNASASSSCVSDLFFHNSCSFSLNSI